MSNTTTTTGPAFHVALMEAKVAKANAKAAKAGLGSPFALVDIEYFTKHEKVNGVVVALPMATWTLVVSGATSIEGWTFAATVDWTLGEPILNVSPALEGGPLARPASRACAHCGTDRDRNVTYLVRHTDGTEAQVGSTCLAAYTGIQVGWVSLVSGLKVTDEDVRGWDGYATDWDLADVLWYAVQIVHAAGYAGANSQGTTTRQRWEALVLPTRTDQARRIKAETESLIAARPMTRDEVHASASRIITWAKALEGGSDYEANLGVIARAGRIMLDRHLGYTLSMVTAHERATARQAERAAAKAAAADVPTGRQVVEGTVTTVKWQDSRYGGSLKMRVVGDAGWAVWGAVPATLGNVAEGTRVRFTAQVEASHGDSTFGFYKRPVKAEIAQAA